MRYSPEKTQPFVFHQYGQIIKAGLFVLLTMMCFRFFFMFKFTDLVILKKNLNLTTESLFLGLRFDLTVVAYITALPLLVSSLGLLLNRERFLYFIPYFNRFFIFGLYLLLCAILICDVNFYAFYQEHLNHKFLEIININVNEMIHRLSRHYALALWVPVVMIEVAVLWFLFKKLFRRERIDLFYAQPIGKEGVFAIIFSILVVLSFLGRGNFSEKALSLDDAQFSEFQSLNELSVNGALALNRAIRNYIY